MLGLNRNPPYGFLAHRRSSVAPASFSKAGKLILGVDCRGTFSNFRFRRRPITGSFPPIFRLSQIAEIRKYRIYIQ
jgi:hypothetical protein